MPADKQALAIYILLLGGHIPEPRKLLGPEAPSTKVRITNWGSPRGDGTYWSAAHFLARTNKAHKDVIEKLREEHKEAMREERDRR